MNGKWYAEVAPTLSRMTDHEAATLAAQILNRVGLRDAIVTSFLEALGDDELQDLAVAILAEPS